jgi:hypothetical protein
LVNIKKKKIHESFHRPFEIGFRKPGGGSSEPVFLAQKVFGLWTRGPKLGTINQFGFVFLPRKMLKILQANSGREYGVSRFRKEHGRRRFAPGGG